MKERQWLLALSISLAMVVAVLVMPEVSRRISAQITTERRNTRDSESYDIRSKRSDEFASVLKRSRQKLSPAQKEKSSALIQQIHSAKEKLARKLPGLNVQFDEGLNIPEIVSLDSVSQKSLTAQSGKNPERIVRDFISDNAALYGLTARQASQLKKVASYNNPAGNLSWVILQQQINGIPVFQGELLAALKPTGEMVRTVSRIVPVAEDASTKMSLNAAVPPSSTIGAAEAVRAAAAAIGVTIDPDSLVLKESSPDGKTFVFEPGPFAEDIKVEMQYFPLEPGVLNLAWSMVLWQDNPAYYTFVDAEGGELLWSKNITNDQTQPATYSVYNDDSPGPLSPSNALPGSGIQGAGINRTSLTLVSELPAFDNLGWITDGGNVTTGNNVDAGLDIVSPNGIDPTGRVTGSPFRVFDFPYNPPPLGTDAPTGANYRAGAVTSIFFWSNRYHDLVYQLGFTEAARNFQQNNFGRGGLGNDFVRAEAQDFNGTNNANFATAADGTLPRMQMFIFNRMTPNRDGDLDGDVFLHELTHGLSNRLHANASGLGSNLSGGMGEGWSDFYARSLLSTADEDVDGVYAAGAYVTLNIAAGFTDNYYYGIRRFPYAVKTNVGANGKPHNPMTYADIDPAQISLTDGAFPRGPVGSASATEVHNIGEVWCMMLLEVRARMIHRLGYAVGNQRALQIVTDGMKLDPVNPTFIDARNSILAADCAGFSGADELDIWNGFATRGLGFSAKGSNATTAVTEGFDMPNVTMGTVTFTDGGCHNVGFADPGELLTLTVPLTNPFCANSIADVTASVVGGGSANYGTIPGGATVSRAIPFHVPSDAPCGSQLTLTVNINGSQGPVSYSFKIAIGQPIATASENFDGVTAPALPAGWTATVPTGNVANNWRTSTASFQSGPNSIFVPDPTTRHEMRLVSPAFVITTGIAQVSFANNYNTENGFDGGVLEISTDNGATFADIIAAGGRFTSGGYNGALATGGGSAPISGRAAWTGNSGGFISTVAYLPESAAGQTVVLRFRMGSDSSVGSAGWFIDNLTISGDAVCVPDNPPVVNLSVASPIVLSFSHDMINVGLAAVITDDCAPSPTVQVSVFGDEEDEEPVGDGNFSPDAKNIALGTLRLRAERNGTKDGRVYLIVVKATDSSGNMTTNCVTVAVPLSKSAADVNSANAQAAAAKAFFLANGVPPAGYFVIGDGPIIGPKQ